MTGGAGRDREEFAERGADIAGVIDRQLERTDLPPDAIEAFTILKNWAITMTAAHVQAMQDAEQVDAVLFGTGPAAILAALRKNLTTSQLATLARMLGE